MSQTQERVHLTEEMKKEIGQHFVFGFHSQELDSDIQTLIGPPYYVGNVILMKRNVRDATQIKTLIRDLQKCAKDAGHDTPLLIGTDQENGLVSAFSTKGVVTQFPGAMALASSGSALLTEQVYAASGKELNLLGVHWTYAPVADINTDKRNPVIGVRSFGDEPLKVSEHVVAAAKGLASSGIVSCLKHFPGHGDTHVDSHLGLPKIMKTKADITRTELIPFKTAFEEAKRDKRVGDLFTIMTGHMALPLFTGSDEPCSLSKVVTHDLLRGEIGFDGVVVTDCLEMDAIAATEDSDGTQGMGANGDREQGWSGGCGVEEGTVRALEVGADIIMICHTMARHVASVERVWDAIESGRISMAELRRSSERIGQLKKTVFGANPWSTLLNERGTLAEEWNKAKAESERISDEAYSKCIVRLKDEKVLPLSPGKVVLYTPENESYNKAVDDAEGVLRTKGGQVRNTAGAHFLAFRSSIQKRAECQHIIYTKAGTEIVEGADQIIFVLRNADRSAWQISALKELLPKNPSARLVVLSSSTPYDLYGVSLDATYAHLASSEYTAQALEAAAAAIFGEIQCTGILPVQL